MLIASIDIGTNTFRILVGKLKGDKLESLYIDRVITRLGGGFMKDGRVITNDALYRGISTLRNFAEVLKGYGVDKIRAVATSVVRESSNGSDFVESVRRETGIRVEVISGEEEARLTVAGVLKSVTVDSACSVIFDIGGGSTEYVCLKKGEIIGLASTRMGVVHLTERFLRDDVPCETDIRMLSKEIDKVLTRELPWLKDLNDDLLLIGTAGTPTTLAAIQLGLGRYDAGLVNGFLLGKDSVLEIFNRLISMPSSERLKIIGLQKGREDVLIPGSLIVLKTMDRFSKDEVMVSDGGLLEGVAYSMMPDACGVIENRT